TGEQLPLADGKHTAGREGLGAQTSGPADPAPLDDQTGFTEEGAPLGQAVTAEASPGGIDVAKLDGKIAVTVVDRRAGVEMIHGDAAPATRLNSAARSSASVMTEQSRATKPSDTRS